MRNEKLKMINQYNDGLNDFFSFVSKAVIIIPIIIVVFSLFFKFNQPRQGLMNQTPTEVQTPNLGVSTKNDSFKFNLQGPIVCDNLFIQNKKILFRNKQINYLLNGDCVYNWETGKSNGEKKCGLSNYVSMAENYLSFLNIDDIVNNNLVKDFIKDKDIDLANVVKSCKKSEIKDKTIFEIPKQIQFITR